jgi:hypothetical protein
MPSEHGPGDPRIRTESHRCLVVEGSLPTRNVLKALTLALVALMVGASALPAPRPTKETYGRGWFTLPDIPCTGFTLTEVMDHEAIRYQYVVKGQGQV